MKKVLLSLVFLAFAGIFAIAQTNVASTSTNSNGPKIKFESMDVDYGTITQGAEPFRTIKFKNIGKEPLIIKSANGNCGCTVPTWPRDAIQPGESNEMKVRYTTERVGQINKKITVITNEAEGENTHVINVKGNITASQEAQGVPATNGTILTPKK
jgi:hypothetical protein